MRVDGRGSHQLTLFAFLLAAGPLVDTSDIARFWAVRARSASPAELHPAYFTSASPAWRGHLSKSGHAEYFTWAYEHYARFYGSAESGTIAVAEHANAIAAALRRFRELYPSPEVPVTIGVGRAVGAGRGYDRRVYLAAEMFVKNTPVDTSELPPWARELLLPPDAIVPAAVHETVHTFQAPVSDAILLVECLREGAPSFLAELVTQRVPAPELHAWCRPRSKQLFREFARRAGSTAYDGWLRNGGEVAIGGRPADVGYWIGYQIARDFYQRARDKQTALRDLVELQDPRGIVRNSRYRWILSPRQPRPRHQPTARRPE